MKTLFLAVLMAGVATGAFAADLPTHKAPMAPAPMYAPAFTWSRLLCRHQRRLRLRPHRQHEFRQSERRRGRRHDRLQLSDGSVRSSAARPISTAAVMSAKQHLSLSASPTITSTGDHDERLRLGFAVDRALFYVTGGYAGVSTHASINDGSIGFAGSQDVWRSGGVIGGGIEYAFTNNISAKAEYLWAPLQRQDLLGGHARRREQQYVGFAGPRRPQLQVLIARERCESVGKAGGRPPAFFFAGGGYPILCWRN